MAQVKERGGVEVQHSFASWPTDKLQSLFEKARWSSFFSFLKLDLKHILDTFHIVKTSSRSPLFAFLLPAVSYMRFRDLPRSSSPLRLFSVTWFITRWRCLGLCCDTRLWFCVRDTTILKAEHKATERNPKSVGSRLVWFASNKFSYLLQLPYYDSLETEIFTSENQDHVSSLVWRSPKSYFCAVVTGNECVSIVLCTRKRVYLIGLPLTASRTSSGSKSACYSHDTLVGESETPLRNIPFDSSTRKKQMLESTFLTRGFFLL